MKLRYETGTATMIHFIVMVLLGFVNAVAAIIEGCKESEATSCIQNSGISLIFLLLLAGWFGFLAILGYAAQDQRSHRLARLLMLAEFMVLVIAVFNARHYPNALSLVTSVLDALFAAWIIVLAFRLSRSKGGRITSKKRGRTRKRPSITEV